MTRRSARKRRTSRAPTAAWRSSFGVVTLAMFGFGYALSPMYDLMCQAFG